MRQLNDRRISTLFCLALVTAGAVASLAASVGEATPALTELLERLGRSVEQFGKEFPTVTCTELVTQTRLGERGKVLYRRDSTFDYLILLDLEGSDLRVEESRVIQRQSGKATDLPLLVSTGFSTLALIFHPFYQGDFEYQRLEDETVGGKHLFRVGFRHVRGSRSTAAVRLRGRDYPLDLEGTAWIDPESSTIVRIKAGLVAPMEDLNLRALNSDVSYAPVRFSTGQESFWLPTVAVIDAATARQRWHNVHEFTSYRHFSVKTESLVSK